MQPKTQYMSLAFDILLSFASKDFPVNCVMISEGTNFERGALVHTHKHRVYPVPNRRYM